jgi:hypothetical protein
MNGTSANSSLTCPYIDNLELSFNGLRLWRKIGVGSGDACEVDFQLRALCGEELLIGKGDRVVGGIRGLFGRRNGPFRISGLDDSSDQQADGGKKQSDGCDKEPFSEECKFAGKFNELGIRLLLLPVRIRYSVAFFSFISAFIICLGLVQLLQ